VKAVRETVIDETTLSGASEDCGRVILALASLMAGSGDPRHEENLERPALSLNRL
jgi:hypothetical protein